jgi:hypothetical protein
MSKKNKQKQKPIGFVDLNSFQTRNSRAVFLKDIVPEKVLVKLKYIVNRSLSNAGINTCSIQLRANGMYDLDPALASTATPGFVEWGAFFRRYRVMKVATKCTFCNREVFPVILNLGFEPTLYAANAKTIGFYAGSNQMTELSGANSNVVVKMGMSKNAEQITGDPMVWTDIGYTGTTGTNPGSLFYVSISADASYLGAVFTALGVSVRWETEFEVEFFERSALNV